eukprot:gene633-438_t
MATVQVPIIDVSNLVKEDATLDEKLVVAREIGKACEEVGFFVIVGHGVPKEIVDDIWASTREFFDLGDAEKNQYVYPQEEYPFGYSGIGTEILSSGKAAENGEDNGKVEHPPDIKEMFSLGPASEKADGPGLQVSKDVTPPVWSDVPFVADGFIINLGDLMKRWTNDKWLSTLHRVIIPEEDVVSEQEGLLCRRRQSMAFFHNLNRDASVECLLTAAGETPKYEPILAGDFLMQKHLAAMGQKSGYK